MSEDEIKVSELNRAITINSADDMMIIQDGINKKVSGDRFFEKIKSIIKPVVLWENLNPEAGMEENTNIDLLETEYDEIKWFFIFSNNGENLEIQQSISCQKQNSVSLFAIGYNTNDTVRRTLEYVSKTQYKALAGKRNNANDSNCCIPVKAVGIKYLNINGNNDDVKIPNQILNEYLEAFNNNFTDKTAEFNNSVEVKINEAKEEINNSLSGSNKYARALPGQIHEQSFSQVYAENPVVEGVEIKGKELMKKTRDNKNKFTTTFSQNGTTRLKSGKIVVEENTQYTFSATSTLGHSLQFAVSYFTVENTLISSSPYYGNGGNFTTPANTKTINIQLRDFENSATNNPINVTEVIEPQLELGTTKTAYQLPRCKS